jgi:hypothetical protein
LVNSLLEEVVIRNTPKGAVITIENTAIARMISPPGKPSVSGIDPIAA